MSVLRKIAKGILTGVSLGTEIMQFPFVSALLQGITVRVGGKPGEIITTAISDFDALSGIAATAEVMYPAIEGAPKLGSARLAASVPFVQNIVTRWAESSLPGHNKVKVPPEKFAADVAKLQSAWVDVLQDFGD